MTHIPSSVISIILWYFISPVIITSAPFSNASGIISLQLPDATATVLISFSKSPETRKKGVPSIFLQCSAKSPNLIVFSSLPYRPKPAEESSVCWSSILTSVSSNISASLSFIPPLAVSILVWAAKSGILFSISNLSICPTDVE